jgi:hypothetical protein
LGREIGRQHGLDFAPAIRAEDARESSCLASRMDVLLKKQTAFSFDELPAILQDHDRSFTTGGFAADLASGTVCLWFFSDLRESRYSSSPRAAAVSNRQCVNPRSTG